MEHWAVRRVTKVHSSLVVVVPAEMVEDLMIRRGQYLEWKWDEAGADASVSVVGSRRESEVGQHGGKLE